MTGPVWEQPVAGSLRIWVVVGRGLASATSPPLGNTGSSARGLAAVISASLGRILCGYDPFVGSSAKIMARYPKRFRPHALKGEWGYRPGFLLPIPHFIFLRVLRFSCDCRSSLASFHPYICFFLDGEQIGRASCRERVFKAV